MPIDQNPWFCRRPTAKGEKGMTFFVGCRPSGRREYAHRLDGHMAFTNYSFTPDGVSLLPLEGVPHQFHFTADFKAKVMHKCELSFWRKLWPTQYGCFPDYVYRVDDVLTFFGCKSRKRLSKVLFKYSGEYYFKDGYLSDREEMEEDGGFIDAEAVNNARRGIEGRLVREWCEENERLAILKVAEIECKRSRGTSSRSKAQLRALGIVA